MDEESKNKSLSLSYILENDETYDSDKDLDKNEDFKIEQDNIKVRSIITFPMLLQHTLRIFLFKKDKEDIPKILDKELLSIFENNLLIPDVEQEEIKEFIELLWEVRFLFDNHIIKWVEDDGNEIHLIRKLEKYKSKDKFYLRRSSKSNEGEALLQSMLYHSQQITTHYWLTPYLNYILDNNGKDSYNYLKYLDNYLLCSSETESLIERTRKFLVDKDYKPRLDITILSESKGTSFPHYWFYKLEYILWYMKHDMKDYEKWKEFKFTAKNSVEHIFPQTQMNKDTSTLSPNLLDSFGNLALVSRSINSEYGNLPFNEKKIRFENNNKHKIDSLKMSLIYKHDIWDDSTVKDHRCKMIELFKEYFIETKR